MHYGSRMLPTMSTADGPAVSARIRRAIRRAGRAQTGVATMSGLSWPQWQRRMRGDVGWRVDEVQRIAEHLGVPLADLIEGSEK
jgi:hypothetical protein